METDNYSVVTKKLEKDLSNLKHSDSRLRRVLKEVERIDLESRPFRIAP